MPIDKIIPDSLDGSPIRLKRFKTLRSDAMTEIEIKSPVKDKVYLALLVGIQDRVVSDRDLENFDEDLRKRMKELGWIQDPDFR